MDFKLTKETQTTDLKHELAQLEYKNSDKMCKLLHKLDFVKAPSPQEVPPSRRNEGVLNAALSLVDQLDYDSLKQVQREVRRQIVDKEL